jgi:hypothetical protein
MAFSFLPRSTIFIVLLVLGIVSPELSGAGTPQNWSRLTFPRGVTADLPSNWVFLSQKRQMTIETAVTALSAFQGWSGYSTEGITAQLRDTDENVIAIFQLRYFPDANTSQAQLEQWDAADLAEASGIMRRNLDAALNRMNLTILKWQSPRLQQLASHIVLETIYQRSSPTGPFAVRMLQVPRGKDTFLITVSWMESQTPLLKPIADWIVASIQIS